MGKRVDNGFGHRGFVFDECHDSGSSTHTSDEQPPLLPNQSECRLACSALTTFRTPPPAALLVLPEAVSSSAGKTPTNDVVEIPVIASVALYGAGEPVDTAPHAVTAKPGAWLGSDRFAVSSGAEDDRDVGVFVGVVAGADAVVAVGGLQRTPGLQVAAHCEDR
jgi:hypothetical protein